MQIPICLFCKRKPQCGVWLSYSTIAVFTWLESMKRSGYLCILCILHDVTTVVTSCGIHCVSMYYLVTLETHYTWRWSCSFKKCSFSERHFKMKSKTNTFDSIKRELQNIRTVDLTKESAHHFISFIWSMIALFGLVWFFFFMKFQIQLWNDKNIILSKALMELSDIDYPL